MDDEMLNDLVNFLDSNNDGELDYHVCVVSPSVLCGLISLFVAFRSLYKDARSLLSSGGQARGPGTCMEASLGLPGPPQPSTPPLALWPRRALLL
jgi:hypothetical protein